MSLEDEYLATPTANEPEYKPKTEFDGTAGFIETGTVDDSFNPDDLSSILTKFGYDPTKVRIIGTARVARWEQFSIKGGGARWLSSYRFNIGPVVNNTTNDLDALIKGAKKRHSDVKASGSYWFVFQAGDHQLGKRSAAGSTEQIVERYVESVERAKAELKQSKRHGIAGMQISFPGDCLEGNQSQSGRNMWLTQETITEQTRILRRLMFHTLEQFAPLVDTVYLDVVNGNHDQAQRFQNTYPGDGWATEAAISVSDALKLNEAAFGHVEVRVPPKWQGYMTVPVGDTTVTVIHGHQWRSGQAFKWWSGQALNGHPAGGSQILQNGHYHSFEVETNAQRTRIASPTFDCGSEWYTEKNGATSKRGGLIYLLKSGEMSRLSCV